MGKVGFAREEKCAVPGGGAVPGEAVCREGRRCSDGRGVGWCVFLLEDAADFTIGSDENRYRGDEYAESQRGADELHFHPDFSQ